MKILFVCKYNVGRSQIASAFFNKLSQKNYSISIGTHVNKDEGQSIAPFESVIKCMAELGYDLSGNFRKQLTPQMARESDKIIVMTKKEDLPDYMTKSEKLIFWDIDDAKGQSYDFHIKIRDEIRNMVEKLIEKIG